MLRWMQNLIKTRNEVTKTRKEATKGESKDEGAELIEFKKVEDLEGKFQRGRALFLGGKGDQGIELMHDAVLKLVHAVGSGFQREFSPDKSIAQLQKEADDGDAYAQYSLAAELIRQSLDDEASGPEHDSKIRNWLQKAAQSGCPEAQLQLGRYLRTTKYGFEKDELAAMDWFWKASVQGEFAGMNALFDLLNNLKANLNTPKSGADTLSRDKQAEQKGKTSEASEGSFVKKRW